MRHSALSSCSQRLVAGVIPMQVALLARGRSSWIQSVTTNFFATASRMGRWARCQRSVPRSAMCQINQIIKYIHDRARDEPNTSAHLKMMQLLVSLLRSSCGNCRSRGRKYRQGRANHRRRRHHPRQVAKSRDGQSQDQADGAAEKANGNVVSAVPELKGVSPVAMVVVLTEKRFSSASERLD